MRPILDELQTLAASSPHWVFTAWVPIER
jgi:hypothetical protein